MKQSEITPLVSVITPVYNGAAFLDNLIMSVHNQDYPLIEHIIIDDGSNDNDATVNILKKYPHLRWWSRPNMGQYATMNEGLEAAKGELICFISADDLMSSSSISHAVNFLRTHPEYVGVYGRYNWIDVDNHLSWYQPPIQGAPMCFYMYIPFIAHCSLYIYKTSLIEKKLYFNPALRFTGDYDWISRIVEARLKISGIDNIMASARWHNEQTSNKYVKALRDETEQILRKHGVNSFIFRAINSTIDKLLIAQKLLIAFFKGNFTQEFQNIREWLHVRKG
jgi:glycosyltransferase involved in cell wall biosynthesis